MANVPGSDPMQVDSGDSTPIVTMADLASILPTEDPEQVRMLAKSAIVTIGVL